MKLDVLRFVGDFSSTKRTFMINKKGLYKAFSAK